MDWVNKPKNYKGLYGILQLLQGSYLDNFSLKTLKVGRVAFHLRTFQLRCLDFQSNRYQKLAPVLSRFCNWLFRGQFFKSRGWPLYAGSTIIESHRITLKSRTLAFYVCFTR